MVFSMVAEFERSVISERTKAGMAAARRRGRHVGRPPKLALDQLDYARRMIVAGEGRAQVARSLGVDPSTLRRLLGKRESCHGENHSYSFALSAILKL